MKQQTALADKSVSLMAIADIVSLIVTIAVVIMYAVMVLSIHNVLQVFVVVMLIA